jgi:beta-catenin-like protein 1
MQSRSRCIKTLDHAMSGASGSEACEVFIHASGLKHLFSALMGKASKKHKGAVAAPPASEDTAHALGMLSSLLSNLPSDADARVRLLAKFVENNYEKTDKMLDIRATAAARLATVDREIAAERAVREMGGAEVAGESGDALYLRRLDSGLYTVQTVDYILAWIIMEDDGVRLLRLARPWES